MRPTCPFSSVERKALPTLVLSLGSDFVVLNATRGWESWFGTRESGLSNVFLENLLQEADWRRLQPLLLRALTGEEARFQEAWNLAVAGSRLVRGACLCHGEGNAGCILVLQDLAENNAEPATVVGLFEGHYVDVAVRESRQRLEGIVQSAMDAIITIDEQQRVVLFNRAAESMFRCTAEQAIGALLDQFIPERFRPVHREHVRHFGETGETTRAMGHLQPLSGLRADGEEFPIEASISQIQVGGQKLFTVILRDITERKRAEENLQRLVDSLAQSNRDLEHFAYVASHDLQEPLRQIVSFIQLLEEKCNDSLDETGREYLSFVVEGAQRMHAMILNLLAYSRVDAASRQRTKVPAQNLLDQALYNLAAALEETRAAVSVDPLPEIAVDPPQLVQVFQNLVGNAVKFRGDNPPCIAIGAALQNDAWRFHVRDNGIGFDNADADRIFQLFQRLHNREKYAGTGLGLAICKRVVERHGGRIWAESEPGKGAAFYFTIPAHADSNRAS